MGLAASFFFFAVFPANAETILEEEVVLIEEEPTLPEEIVLVEETEPPLPAETEPVEEAPTPMFWSRRPSVLSIAEAQALTTGTEEVTIQGTVVYASGILAVLQDDTGGIRLSFAEAPEVAPGDVLLVTGKRSGGFAVTDFEKAGTADLPSVEATLQTAPENTRIHLHGAVLGRRNLQQDGLSMEWIGTRPDTVKVGDTVECWGVILDGRFYGDAILPLEPEPPSDFGWNLYFGQLHAHTNISDGEGTVAEAFSHAADVAGLDFFAVTDHSNSFDNAGQGSIGTDGTGISTEWAAGKAAAAAATNDGFVGIFGYEMTWPETLALGHMNTFQTPGWQTREQPGFDTLEGYCKALTTVPNSISQFNHPGPAYGDFEMFSDYAPEYDAVIHLLEVGSENGKTAYNYYTRALDKGWHVAPTNNQNNHHGQWGTASDARTVILAETLTEESLYDAMRAHRVYATEDSDLSIMYQLNGYIMGSVISPAESLTITVAISDPTDSQIGLVEVIADGGKTVASQTVNAGEASLSMRVPGGYNYYYLRITQPDQQIAVTAPVWVDSGEDMGIASFTADKEKPEINEEVTLTLTLYNHEAVPFILTGLTVTEGETELYQATNPGTVAPMDSLTLTIPCTRTEPGEKTVTATVTGTAAGKSQRYTQTLTLHVHSPQAEAVTIAQARAGELGKSYRVSGYITAGNANPYNTFPGTLYLQDGTGGIAIAGSGPENIQVGTPMEFTGCLRNQAGNLVLELTDWNILETAYYRFVPETQPCAKAMNDHANGGKLLQVEGEVVSLVKTSDGKGVTRFSLKDTAGDLATLIIEEGIGSLTYGGNDLASRIQKGDTVRAMGILHVDEYGITVLRVRNCDEVVYVPPIATPDATGKPDTSNPKTGDYLFFRK